jgi:hypothetical protein
LLANSTTKLRALSFRRAMRSCAFRFECFRRVSEKEE